MYKHNCIALAALVAIAGGILSTPARALAHERQNIVGTYTAVAGSRRGRAPALGHLPAAGRAPASRSTGTFSASADARRTDIARPSSPEYRTAICYAG